MEFRILGPLEAWHAGREVSLGGPKPRALLALLLLHANEVVPSDRLTDELWGTSPQGRALQVNVSRLRKALPEEVLETRAPGYLIRVEGDELDLHRFERLVEEGRRLLADERAEAAAGRLREALSLWRGPALAEFAYESFAQAPIARIEEIRLAATELRVEADLRLGRHHELVAELEKLVAEHPLREELRASLMVALYRSGRQAEALDAYQAARRTFADQLGIDPGPALRQVESAVLRQDPALDLDSASPGRMGDKGERSILLASTADESLDGLLPVAEALARHPPRVLILARVVRNASELRPASASLEERRALLEPRQITARTATFTSSAPGQELARLARELDVDLMLTLAPAGLLEKGIPDAELSTLLEDAPCDVGLLVSRDATPDGPIVVPFGGAEHDWAAVELGAWYARAVEQPLVLAGSEAVPEHGRRDASRLLSHGALAVQRVLGIPAETLLAPAGDEGMLEVSNDAGLLVVGLSTRWHHEGLGSTRLELVRRARPTTVLVRRGLRPGGLAPPATLTRFTWSIRPDQAGVATA